MTWTDRLIPRLFNGAGAGEIALAVYGSVSDPTETPTHCAERLGACIPGAERPASHALDVLTHHATTHQSMIDSPVEFLSAWWEHFGFTQLELVVRSLDQALAAQILVDCGYPESPDPHGALIQAALDLWTLREIAPSLVGADVVVH